MAKKKKKRSNAARAARPVQNITEKNTESYVTKEAGSQEAGITGNVKLWMGTTALLAALLLLFGLMYALQDKAEPQKTGGETPTQQAAAATPTAAAETSPEPEDVPADGTDVPEDETAEPEEPQEKNGEIIILATSDVHCGIDQGFGYAGLWQIRESLENEGYTTLLVDDGDSIQGEAIGTLSRGEAIIELMNELDYDVAIPGNHEFDYGMEQFLALTEKAEFPYISCNFNKEGEPVFAPYVIKEVQGQKIAFVGVTTPKTLTSSTPAYFQNEQGEFIYGFMQDLTGEAVYAAVQKAVDDARAEGAGLVYVMAHLGNEANCSPWTYADVISHTSGIDVLLDGHSHDTEKVVMKNALGEDVVRLAVGTKLSCVGYSHIDAEGKVTDNGIYNWPNEDGVVELLKLDNVMGQIVKGKQRELNEQLGQVVAHSEVELTIYDPEAKDTNGQPIRMVRRAETNLGDLCADAIRVQSGADVGIMNGGGVRKSIKAGDITYGDIYNVHPFGNKLCVVEMSGQQLLDALEWSVSSVPDEFGGFLQVSGMSYEVDMTIPSSCVTDENHMFIGAYGLRRIRNVMVGDEPLDPFRTYTVAGYDYTLLSHGDGYTSFDGATLLQDCVMLDNQLLINYIQDTLGGSIGEEYSDPCGQGRIVFIE